MVARKQLVSILKRVVSEKLEDSPTVYKMVKKELEEAFERVDDQWELIGDNGYEKSDALESDNGGLRIEKFTLLRYFDSAGLPKNKPVADSMKESIDSYTEYAVNDFIKGNPEFCKEHKLDATTTDFRNKLYKINDSKMIEIFEGLRDAYFEDDSEHIPFTLEVVYDEIDDNEYELTVSASIDYISTFDETLEFKSALDLKPKLVKAMKEACESML